jgi:hypothetical protein
LAVKRSGVKMAAGAKEEVGGEIEAEEGVEREEQTVLRWEEETFHRWEEQGRGEGGGGKGLGVFAAPSSICLAGIPGLVCFGGGG